MAFIPRCRTHITLHLQLTFIRAKSSLFNPFLRSASIFSTLFSIHILRWWWWEFAKQSIPLLLIDHFLFSHNLYRPLLCVTTDKEKLSNGYSQGLKGSNWYPDTNEGTFGNLKLKLRINTLFTTPKARWILENLTWITFQSYITFEPFYWKVEAFRTRSKLSSGPSENMGLVGGGGASFPHSWLTIPDKSCTPVPVRIATSLLKMSVWTQYMPMADPDQKIRGWGRSQKCLALSRFFGASARRPSALVQKIRAGQGRGG